MHEEQKDYIFSRVIVIKLSLHFFIVCSECDRFQLIFYFTRNYLLSKLNVFCRNYKLWYIISEPLKARMRVGWCFLFWVYN